MTWMPEVVERMNQHRCQNLFMCVRADRYDTERTYP